MIKSEISLPVEAQKDQLAWQEQQSYRANQVRSRRASTDRRVALYPIIFFELYLTFSVLVFAFGPWPWPVSNPAQLYTFLALAQIALFLGYRSAVRKRPQRYVGKFSISRLVAISLILNYLWVPILFQVRTGRAPTGPGDITSAVSAGLDDPGQQYALKQREYVENSEQSSTIVGYLTLLIYPVLWLSYSLGIVYWRQLPMFTRVALVVWIIIDVCTWIAAGTNKGIADFVTLLPSLLVARNPSLLVKKRLRSTLLIGFVGILGLIGLFTFFSKGIGHRGGTNVSMMLDDGAGIAADPESLVLRYLDPDTQSSVASFAAYLSQGYYGLSLSLQEPFVFCYGVGNSFFLEGLSRRFVSEPIISDTYPARIEKYGWNLYGKWNSIYPWLASDLSFPGVIIFMFFLGRLFAVVWLDVAFAQNPWAVCLFSLLLIMLLYIPANNQVLCVPGTAMPFWVFLAVWVYSRNGRAGTFRQRRLA